jgi:hypothetical protein
MYIDLLINIALINVITLLLFIYFNFNMQYLTNNEKLEFDITRII